ncbi:hypothetical protein G4B88_011362 [Cannabis sativa]|uniref:NADP-dependent oxidoreductase domain-containing protein n=1 Tax=Cannabis sativa TaxID=3483 RepID=A0A7J6GJ95_CANSA|nr:hypothetical protein G4B88_011362 [Cannabis sativa]
MQISGEWALLHHAINSGITFLDTSNIYGPFTNEILLGQIRLGGVAGVRPTGEFDMKRWSVEG